MPVIDRVWPGAIGMDGLSLGPGSNAFSVIMADVRLATMGLSLMATEANVMAELTSRQCADVCGELLSRRGYEITMADIPMIPGGLDDSVYIYAGKRVDIGSFLYTGESVLHAPDDEIGIGLIRDMIGVAHEENGSASILAATSFIARGGGECDQRFEWQLDLPDYTQLTTWLDDAHRAPGNRLDLG
jgi:hypothetical protein